MSLNPIIIYVVIGAMVAFILVSAIKSFGARNKLLQSGNLVPGRIIEHRDSLGVATRFGDIAKHGYYLTFSFEYQGTSLTQEKGVTEETYRAFNDGDAIRVRCLPDHPIIADAVDF